MPRVVNLTYFKESGKYYTSGEYTTEVLEYHDFEIYDEVRRMQEAGKLPGLGDNCREFDIHVGSETVVPALIKGIRYAHKT